MKTQRAAFICYTLATLILLTFGVKYLGATQAMPYHLEALRTTWTEVPYQYKFLYLSLIHGIGWLMLATSALLAFIFIFPFRKNEKWSRWAITITGLITGLPILFIAFDIKQNTAASTPVTIAILFTSLFIIGFAFSSNKSQSLKLSFSKRTTGNI